MDTQWWRICLPMPGTWVWSLGQENPPEKEMATHSSILAWRIPWTEEPGELRVHRVRNNWVINIFTFKTGKKEASNENVYNPHPKQNYECYLILCKSQINSLWQRRILSFHGPFPKIQVLLKKNSPVLDAHFQATYWPFGAWFNWKKEKVKSLSCVQLFATPWAIAYQSPPSMGFSRQEYWSRLPFPSPGDLSDPRIEPGSLTLHFNLWVTREARLTDLIRDSIIYMS